MVENRKCYKAKLTSSPFLHIGLLPPLWCCLISAKGGALWLHFRTMSHNLLSFLKQRQRKAHVYLLMVKPGTLRTPPPTPSAPEPFSFTAPGLTSGKASGTLLCFLVFGWHWLDSRGDWKGVLWPALRCCASHSCLLVFCRLHFCFLEGHYLRLEAMSYLPSCPGDIVSAQ